MKRKVSINKIYGFFKILKTVGYSVFKFYKSVFSTEGDPAMLLAHKHMHLIVQAICKMYTHINGLY